jgi:hypothetical protein
MSGLKSSGSVAMAIKWCANKLARDIAQAARINNALQMPNVSKALFTRWFKAT